MPIYFLTAGFFGSMLFYERGIGPMVKNRIFRIAFPFVAFLCPLNPVILLSLKYTAAAFSTDIEGISTEIGILPRYTYHLWFLYYLVIITAITVSVAWLLDFTRTTVAKLVRVFEWLLTRRLLAIGTLAFLTFLIMLYMWDYWVPTPLDFMPNAGVILFYLQFYLVGWILFKAKHLLASLMRYDWLFAAVATCLFTAKFIWSSHIGDVLLGAMNAVISWLFVFGITGLFIRHASRHSSTMRYVSDSSYWAYLIHLPLTILVPGIFAIAPLPALVKFTAVLLTTVAFCLLTYRYLVRSTFIGKFLNGRKYGRTEPM